MSNPEEGNETRGEARSRRGFFRWLAVAIGAAALAEAAWVVVDFLRPRSRRAGGADAEIFVAGPVDRFAEGSVTAFPAGKFYLVRLGDGGFLAVSRRCTHLGCTVPWVDEERRFVCPCHSSAFDLRGVVLSPPAPRPLDVYPVRIENRIVKVETGRTLRRRAFDVNHVAYP